MCGIAGIIGSGLDTDGLNGKLRCLSQRLQHRGPDDQGIFVDADAGIGLVHRRLSIIDLSPAGHQPMTSPDGRYVITFNGEIYNFEILREELASRGSQFVGTSDTEVLLHAISTWGLRDSLVKAIGMFALALWDRHERILYLARDRLGEKPLGFARLDRGISFASEFSALRAAGLVDSGLNRQALALYLKYAYVPAPYAIYSGSEKVMPGTIVAISARDEIPTALQGWSRRGTHGRLSLFEQCYWQARASAADSLNRESGAATGDVEARFRELLEDSVALQLRADVPVGAFLSGGIDSSLVCAVAQSVSNTPVRTFTMGFDNTLFDESRYAARVAEHLGTNHTCVEVSAGDVLRWVPDLARLSDEPFADPSQLPTFLVSRIAREYVTVCLTGDGGDELFGGYNRYIEPMRLRQRMASIPPPLKRAIAGLLRATPAGPVDTLFGLLAKHTGSRRFRVQSPGKKLHKLADAVTTEDPRTLYEILMSHWRDPAELLSGLTSVPEIDATEAWKWEEFPERAMLWDIAHYLPDNNLAKVDRASMAISLETRLPLLDFRIVELAIAAPLPLKLTPAAGGKRLLRSVLRDYLPDDLIERPKMGFSVPVAAWLRGPLRDWAEDLLSPSTLARVGLFEPEPVRACWREHVSGSADHYQKLWLVLQAHAWELASREMAHSAPASV